MLDKTIIENLKRVDPDRYRASVFAEPEIRANLMTLYAFHAELAKVPDMVSEPMIGEIRYQWWRDAIEEIYSGGTVRKHEVATPLAQLIKTTNLPRYKLDKLIDARSRDLDPTPFASLDDARSYCRETSGNLMVIAGILTGGPDKADQLEPLGEAWGLTGLARSWRYYKGSMLSGLSFDELLGAAEELYVSSNRSAGSAYMPAGAYGALIPGYLRRMRSSAYAPDKDTPNYSRFRKQCRMMAAVLKGHS